MSNKEIQTDESKENSIDGLAIMRKFSEKYPESFNPEETDENGVPFIRTNFSFEGRYSIVSKYGIVSFTYETPDGPKLSDCDLTPIIDTQLLKYDPDEPQPEFIILNKDRTQHDGIVRVVTRSKFKNNSHLNEDARKLDIECSCHKQNIKFRKERFNLPPIVYPGS